MIILQCLKCGQSAYLELNKPEVKQKKTICKACGKPEIKVKTFEMPEPRMGWKCQ